MSRTSICVINNVQWICGWLPKPVATREVAPAVNQIQPTQWSINIEATSDICDRLSFVWLGWRSATALTFYKLEKRLNIFFVSGSYYRFKSKCFYLKPKCKHNVYLRLFMVQGTSQKIRGTLRRIWAVVYVFSLFIPFYLFLCFLFKCYIG